MFSLARKLGPLLAAAAMIATVVTPSLAAPARAGGTLLIYTHLQDAASSNEVKVLKDLAQAWASKTGNQVKVVVDKGTFQSFTTLARTGKGPDIMFGIPHDNVGTFQLAGLVAPVPAGVFNPADYPALATQAVSFGGKPYSVPLLLETTTLNYNKRLVHSAPRSWDEIIKIAKTFGNKRGLPYGILWDIANYYFSYALISGMGGYTFKEKQGSYDTSNVGLDNTGAVSALTMIRDFVLRYKLVPSDINYGTAQSLFQKGQVGMFIDGSWDIDANKKALGKDYGVTTLPPLPGGKIPHPYAGVSVAFVSAFSKQQPLAWDFVKSVAPKFGIPGWRAAGRFPALKADLDSAVVQSDPIAAGFAKQLLVATPMPNVAEMNSVWGPAGNALKLVVTGKATPAAAAANAVKQIKLAISQLKQ